MPLANHHWSSKKSIYPQSPSEQTHAVTPAPWAAKRIARPHVPRAALCWLHWLFRQNLSLNALNALDAHVCCKHQTSSCSPLSNLRKLVKKCEQVSICIFKMHAETAWLTQVADTSIRQRHVDHVDPVGQVPEHAGAQDHGECSSGIRGSFKPDLFERLLFIICQLVISIMMYYAFQNCSWLLDSS